MEEEVEKRLVIDTGSSLVNLPSMAFFFDKCKPLEEGDEEAGS